MAIDLTTIFGTQIRVGSQPRTADRQYVGFPGAHGLVTTHMGSRGFRLIVRGRISRSGASYAVARAACESAIGVIEQYQWAPADSYSFMGTVYNDVVLERFELVPDSQGKFFHWTKDGYVVFGFIAYLRGLV